MSIPVYVHFRNFHESTDFIAKVQFRSISQVYNLFMRGYDYTCYSVNYKNEAEYRINIGAIRTLQEKLKNCKRIRVSYMGDNYGFIKGKCIDSIDISYANR